MFTARARAAFTLLEVTLAVAILALMSLAIYRFVQSNITTMRISSEMEATDASYDGLRELLMQQLQSLPPGSGALIGDAFRTNDEDRDVITWICGAGPGVLTRYADGDYRVSLRLQRADKKSDRLDLGLLRQPKGSANVSHSDESWVRLLPDVRQLQIRYFDSRLNTWVQRWTDAVTLPRLVKLTIVRRDLRVPFEMIIPLARTPL